ncbi:virulence factor family protein [Methylovulum miyakonense]|uniref:virulence factor family protein n=1 Tax=Methylovulum miyakonense TaxID=645578 RepID=UPI000367094C|nr:AcvB/VirJ family lysyl-phosphatidylglycerol hydrolase [Methylovulum miyakonense]
MKTNKTTVAFLLFGFTALAIALAVYVKPPVVQELSRTESFGELTVTRPLWGSQGLAIVFADTKKFPASVLGRRVAALGMATAIINPWPFFKRFNAATGQCLDANAAATSIASLLKGLPPTSTKPLVIAGISEGALLPFLNAQSSQADTATNLAIDFSVNLPDGLAVCPPLASQDPKNTLLASTALKGHWRPVWTDHPAGQTAVFIKAIGNTNTRIAAYDTPLDAVLLEELKASLGQTDPSSQPLPLVDVPAAKPNGTITVFYSGDGGWRDLDRTVAGEMAAQNYPVVGVDALRYFWERKTPGQVAADLSATMAYYRNNRGIKFFVLAGYSFGADILPAVYNRLPQQDQDSVRLLVLLALANNADFEIHVSGWLGQNAGELPQAPELAKIPKTKILCIYGKEEKSETACTGLQNSDANILELPGGHHFDQDYPKLTRQILDVYRQHGIN